tara:strand:- start:8 stop:460 length:453 start_codon:yes stop_codon:yes gene_type:complete
MPDFFFPNYSLKTKNESNKTLVYDELRNKWIQLSPEENVRQHLWRYLNIEFNYPKSLMEIEKKVVVNKLEKRFDLLISNKSAKPLLIAECKAPNVKLNEKTLEQILRYNIQLKANFLLITNGIELFCSKIDFKKGNLSFLKKIPNFHDIS